MTAAGPFVLGGQALENRKIVQNNFKACLCVLVLASIAVGAEGFHWDWRRSQELSYQQSLRRVNITSADRDAIARAIAEQIRPEMSALGIDSEHQLKDVALSSRIKVVRLSRRSTSEVIVQGTGDSAGCSPTGNCPFWVFQRSHDKYKLLGHEQIVQSFTIEDTRSSGYKDIVVGMHGSATETTLTLLRYRDGKYREAGCYEARWSVLKGDVIHMLKEPLFTPCTLNK
jgi:hypothetical protein